MSVEVPKNYKCPLCPCCTGESETFFFSNIVGAPICQGCSIDIDSLIEEDSRPDDPLLDKLESMTGLSFNEYKKIGFMQFIETYESFLKPENIEREAKEAMRVTGKSFEEFVAHWKEVVSYYSYEINKLT